MLASVEMVLPMIRESMVMMIPGSPRAWERYTHRRGGEVGGYPQSQAFSMFRSISHRSGLLHFWLCGDGVFPGAGTIGESVSVFTCIA
ncbi:hypothetical protein LS684_11885 [Cytobacillus spongiae]|uniref:hypothetical protein n=1 Tax=Cytobacillus spongiae TaxID=2901381 RepID=UPI001F4797AB|nr:hypothetical protein [Cytobacillus spongiae]UII54381.1 hypothetical protein LS684_11885 [Cytobacillus spongiae]